MKQNRHKPEEVIRLLRECDSSSLRQEQFCRQKQISIATRHRWRKKYGQMDEADAKRTHDETAAEALLLKGLAVVQLTKEDLARMPKGVLEKQVLAWWLRQQTVVSRSWISQALRMGDESRVTQAVRTIKQSNMGQVVRWKKVLNRLAS